MKGFLWALYEYAQDQCGIPCLEARECHRATHGLEEDWTAFRSTLTAEQARILEALLDQGEDAACLEESLPLLRPLHGSGPGAALGPPELCDPRRDIRRFVDRAPRYQHVGPGVNAGPAGVRGHAAVHLQLAGRVLPVDELPQGGYLEIGRASCRERV